MSGLSNQVRGGWLGAWDRLVGPGATAGENLGTLGVGLLAAIAAGIDIWLRRDVTVLQLSLVAILAFDLAGGVWANATPAARRWYHRPGQGFLQHFGFIAVHIQPFLLPWLFPDFVSGWEWATLLYVGVVLGTVVLYLMPSRLRTAGALTYSTFLLALTNQFWVSPLAWFAAAFILKLLVAHLLPEIPGKEKPAAVSGAGLSVGDDV
ncbi:MAG: hypothetical protein KC800_18250 [Candidatus Eremiobacteraeota bacterium]|nr:hypothetical protein [Candidatus Eremiobacteraeota bacterium]